MTQPKQIIAWAVVGKDGRIDAEDLYESKEDAEYTISFYRSGFKTIKVRITPIAKGK